ncbi:Fe-S cluster assembly scaffold protein NifU [Candidatus Microgenomates bacterium]|jgi:nitrogen fixation NifU-like protein|nr:MAG: Fe-S cluster assembly scaffold protein NifU [Candidatus Microgenomates bacterium]
MSDLSNLYSEKVLDHFQNPRNLGEIKNPDGVGTVGNRVCGDIMRLFIKVEEKNGEEIIKDVKFQTLGCGAAIATSSIATELIKGKPLSQALALTNKAIAEALGGLPKAKMHCSVLAADAVKKAIEDFRRKK